MPADEYWNGDSTLVIGYRKAYRLKQDAENRAAWLHGLYVYDAFSTVVHNALCGKKGTPKLYAEKPYSASNDEPETSKEERDGQNLQAMVWMHQFVQAGKKE